MKENEQIRDNDALQGQAKDLKNAVTRLYNEDPDGFEYARENLSYLAAYLQHISEKLKEEIRRHPNNLALKQQEQIISKAGTAFANLLENYDPDRKDADYQEMAESIIAAKNLFLQRDDNYELIYNQLKQFDQDFEQGMDTQTFGQAMDSVGEKFGLGLGGFGKSLQDEVSGDGKALSVGQMKMDRFVRSELGSFTLRMLDPYEDFLRNEWKKYEESIGQVLRDNDRNLMGSGEFHEACLALHTEVAVLNDLISDHQKLYDRDPGGTLQQRQDLAIRMGQSIGMIQRMHKVAKDLAPKNHPNAFFRNDSTNPSVATEQRMKQWAFETEESRVYFANNTMNFFKADNAKHKMHYYDRTNPLTLEVPGYASKEMAMTVLAQNLNNNKKLKLYFHEMRNNLAYFAKNRGYDSRVLSDDNEVKDHVREQAEKLHDKFTQFEEKLNALSKDIGDKTKQKKALEDAVEAFNGLQQTMKDIKQNFSMNPEVIRCVHEICGTFPAMWQTINFSKGIKDITKKYPGLDLKIPENCVYMPRWYEADDYELRDLTSAQLHKSEKDLSQENNSFNQTETELQTQLGKKVLQDALSNSGFFKTLKSWNKQIKDIRDAAEDKIKNSLDNTWTQQCLANTIDRRSGKSSLNSAIRTCEQFVKNHKAGDEIDGQTAYDVGHAILEAQKGFITASTPSRVMNYRGTPETFMRYCGGIVDAMEKQFVSVVKNADPVKHAQNYIASHRGAFMPPGNDDKDKKIEAAAKAVAAYHWMKEANDPKNAGKKIAFSTSKIENYARTLKNNPLFKTAVDNRYTDPESTKDHTIARLYDVVVRPFTIEASKNPDINEKYTKALKELQKLGRILDTAKGAGADYQKFFKSLKKLDNMDLDFVTMDKKCELLNEIYQATDGYMKGRKSTRFFKEAREHFEQCLDALAILKTTGNAGKELADRLVERTNEVRRSHWFQSEVSLEGRNNVETMKRLAALRKIQGTEKSDLEIAVREKTITDEGLIRANEDFGKKENADRLKEMTGEKLIDVSKKQTELQRFLKESKSASPFVARKNISSMLALSIIPAFKDAQDRAVIRESDFNAACEIMQQHTVVDDLVKTYKSPKNRKDLANHAEPLKHLRSQFDSKVTALNAKLREEDAQMLGPDAKGLDYQQYKQACANKIRQDEINEKKKLAEEKNQRRKEAQMDKEYIKYLNRITGAKMITPARRKELLLNFYVSGVGDRPIAENVKNMVDADVQKKGNAQKVKNANKAL